MIRVIDLTQKLVQLNTINPPGNECEATRIIGSLLENAGFSVDYFEFADTRTSLVASTVRGNEEKIICFTGHLDTVPLGDAAWSVDPFSGEISGDKLFGRGTSDMKSGVAAIVCAALDLADDLNDDETPGIILAITASEETGCQGAFHLCEVNEIFRKVDAIIVGEPTANYPLLGHKGALWLDIFADGKTAHGSMPEIGVNAIYRGAKIVNKLETFIFDETPHEILGGPTINVGTINGGMNINSIPDIVHIGVDIRTTPNINHNKIKDEITHYLKPEIENMSTIIDLDAVWTKEDHYWVQKVFDICKHHVGQEILPRGANYFTDACAFKSASNSNIPVLILGPGEPELAHQSDEYCYISRIEQAVGIYKDIMKSWCNTS